MTTISSQITSLTIIYSTVYSGADQSKYQSSASLAFVWGIHRGPVNSPRKWPVTRKMVPFYDVIMCCISKTNLPWTSTIGNIPLRFWNWSVVMIYYTFQESWAAWLALYRDFFVIKKLTEPHHSVLLLNIIVSNQTCIIWCIITGDCLESSRCKHHACR